MFIIITILNYQHYVCRYHSNSSRILYASIGVLDSLLLNRIHYYSIECRSIYLLGVLNALEDGAKPNYFYRPEDSKNRYCTVYNVCMYG
jgi:hypothetical protein